MTEISTYLCYRDVYRVSSTRDEFENGLRTLDLSTVLRVFAAINSIVSRRGLPRNRNTQLQLVRELFEHDVVKRIESFSLDVFHRKQCLFVLREAMRLCPDAPSSQFTSEIRYRIGQIGLMANDHVSSNASPGETETDELLAHISDFIPVVEANELKFEFACAPRMHKMVSDLAPAHAGGAEFFDIADEFERSSGLPLDIFEMLMLCIFPRVLFSAMDLAKQSTNYGVPLSYFDQTKVQPKHRDAFFRLVSRSAIEFKEKLSKRPPLLSDFTVIRDMPFLTDGNHLVPLDTTFCIEKSESAVFWSIYTRLPENKKIEFSAFWAKLFEDYIGWLLSQSVDNRINRFYATPRYKYGNHDEVCDGIVICGATAIFIECKGGMVRGDAKYGGDPQILKEELEKKYVKPPGVYQLAKAITIALNRPDTPTIEGLDLSGIKVVMPLLIIRDDIGDAFFVNSYLNQRFSEAKRELGLSTDISPTYCSSLFCVSVDVIEKLTPYLIDTRLADILAQRYIADPLLRAPFFLKPNSALSSKGADRPPILLKSVTEDLRDHLAKFLTE